MYVFIEVRANPSGAGNTEDPGLGRFRRLRGAYSRCPSGTGSQRGQRPGAG